MRATTWLLWFGPGLLLFGGLAAPLWIIRKHVVPAVAPLIVVSVVLTASRAVITAVLPRRSAFTRRAAGDVTVQQVVAANVDVVFVVMGLDRDFNPRRLERYLLMAHESGASW